MGATAAAPVGEAVLRARNVSRYFPIGNNLVVQAVDGVDLEIYANQTVGLVGESGCGKTTLGRLLVGLIDPSSGVIEFKGRPVPDLDHQQRRTMRRAVQMIFQDPASSLNPKHSIERILRTPLLVHHLASSAEVGHRVTELLDLVGLPGDVRNRFPAELSGGQQQRVGIARALSLDPEILIADEPLASLDVSVQAQIVNLLADLQARLGLGVLFVSHDLSVVSHIADRVVVMYLGRVVESSPADAMFQVPQHPYTRGLIAAVPEIEPDHAHVVVPVRGEPPSPAHPPSGCRFHPRCPIAELPLCATVDPILKPTGKGRVAACHFVPEVAE